MKKLLSSIKNAFKVSAIKDFYFSSKKIRVRISLLFGLIFSTGYLLFNLVSGIVYRSPSFLTVSAFYMLLAMVRYIILKSAPNEKNTEAERQACRISGIILLVADALIALMIFYSTGLKSNMQYGIIVFTVLGVHTLYSVVGGIFGILEGRRDGILAHRAAYSVKIAAASMSLFNLLSALILSFVSARDIADGLILFIGIAVCSNVFFLSCSMIFSSRRRFL